ncbi:MAG: DUF4215 domain-containing protein, partial [Myxococcales bacterium]|nr:DUF4215 domain-containing protein [Myxococcales bacterium]
DRCGDGAIDDGEECDDGADNSDLLPDACRTTCVEAHCGDGVVDASEQCDGGEGCSSRCTVDVPGICGDGVLNAGEECDDGNDVDEDECSNDCIAAQCGDGVVNGDEECDDGNDVDEDLCSSECVTVRPDGCGDGVVAGDEECDDGNAIHDDECSNLCRLAYCGDGIRQAVYGEECDDGNTNPVDGCSNRCTRPVCGDGVLQAGEECDQGSDNSDTGPNRCRTTCVLPFCGDGVADNATEECDDGADNSDTESGACRTECVAPTCGDGVVDPGEGCDEGDANSTAPEAACRPTCFPAGCGDGVVNGDEECDDGNAIDNDACTRACRLPICGDGIVQGDEECDTGAARSDSTPDACRTTCARPGCGDGVVDTGEECDDGNTADGDACPGSCAFGNRPPTAVITCVTPSGGRATDAFSEIVCNGSASTDVDGTVTGYSWMLASKPATSAQRLRATSGTTTSFIADAVGDYTVYLYARDDAGEWSTTIGSVPPPAAIATIEAKPFGRLYMEVTWLTPGDPTPGTTTGADLDAHLLYRTTAATSTTCWGSRTDDCHFANTTPAWGAELVADDLNGDGPESISMATLPASGELWAGVEHYSSHSRGSSTATVILWVDETEVFRQSHLFTTDSQFWSAARVSMPAMLVTPVDLSYTTRPTTCE